MRKGVRKSRLELESRILVFAVIVRFYRKKLDVTYPRGKRPLVETTTKYWPLNTGHFMMLSNLYIISFPFL